MSKRKIINIVFYAYKKNGEMQYESCIFYNDGTEKTVTLKEAIPECRKILKEKNVTSVLTMDEMIKKSDGIFHVMTKKEFIKRHDEFVSKEILNDDIIEEFFKNKLDKISNANNRKDEMQASNNRVTPFLTPTKNKEGAINTPNQKKAKNVNLIKKFKIRFESICLALVILATSGVVFGCSNRKTKAGIPKNNSFFARMINKDEIEDNKEIKGTTDSVKENQKEETEELNKSLNDEIKDNSKWDGKSYDELLKLTHNQKQKDAMINIRKALLYFNDEFAKEYLEEGSNIRAALSFDEMLSLYVAFNDLDKEAIKAIFNGEEVDSDKMGRNYRSAFLQVFGAYIISNSETPVDLSSIIDSAEGKKQYQNYLSMYYRIKDAAEGETKALVKEFYDELRKDYPFSEKSLTEGIAHADEYNNIDGSMLPIMMITAALEVQQKSLTTNETLSTIETEISEDMAGCQIAYGNFDEAEIITLTTDTDNTSPTLTQFRDAINTALDEKGINVPESEKDRDLSKLMIFKYNVNPEGALEVQEITKSRQELETGESLKMPTGKNEKIKTWETKTTTITGTKKEIKEGTMPTSEKDKIDKEIGADNKKALEEGNKQADKKQEEMQKIEDEKAKKIEQEVKDSEADWQRAQETVNNIINQNNSDTNSGNDTVVTETDFGDHNVKFSDDHSNGNGDLNNSVKNITTDPTNDKTGTGLPDPQDTEKEFEKRVKKTTFQSQNATIQEQTHEEQQAEPSQDNSSKETQEEQQAKPKQENRSEESHEEQQAEPNQDNRSEESHEEQQAKPSQENSSEESHKAQQAEPSQDNRPEQPNSVTHHEVKVTDDSWYEYDVPNDEEKVLKLS